MWLSLLSLKSTSLEIFPWEFLPDFQKGCLLKTPLHSWKPGKTSSPMDSLSNLYNCTFSVNKKPAEVFY